MLNITIPATREWDEDREILITIPETKLQLEHSLLSIKTWESKWHKPFLGKDDKTTEEMRDYIRCMTINKNVDPIIYEYMPSEVIQEINDYIRDPHTATTFTNFEEIKSKIGRRRVITAEIIYYWMVTLNIPVEFQKWHIQQLIALIKVINIENAPKKKISAREAARRRDALNEARKRKYHTKG